jgi:uncharacterized protein (TIGR02186 family)
MQRLWLALVVVMAMPSPAAAERLVTALSHDSVSISSNFTGLDIALFGMIERDGQTISRSSSYELVVVAEGPPQSTQVRLKSRSFGIWLNTDSERIIDMPSFLLVQSTHAPDRITLPILRARHGLGLDMLAFDARAEDKAPLHTHFEAAFLRLKQANGLYRQDDQGVIFLGKDLFRTRIHLPATVPVGTYKITAYLFRDNALLASTDQMLEIRKVGFEQWLTSFAHHNGYVYGLATVLIACLTGWLASVIFRKD